MANRATPPTYLASPLFVAWTVDEVAYGNSREEAVENLAQMDCIDAVAYQVAELGLLLPEPGAHGPIIAEQRAGPFVHVTSP